MNESGSNFADETIEMVSESANNASAELRKRRSTRIVQAVPLVVTGVDALGRPFVERTSSLIINCHGCRYQSKHYVLKNMWVTMEIPHPESGQLPRTVRGRVAWIQRPRTVRQLFQVALELEVSGTAWGIAFPPEDWTAFPDLTHVAMKLDASPETSQLPPPSAESETTIHLDEAEIPPAAGADNLRVFPSPTSTTDASLQLARQVARLVADAKQQIQATAQEAASQAVSAERRLSFEQWEQKFAAGRAETATRAHEEAAKQREEAATAQLEALRATANEIQQQVTAALSSAQSSSQGQLANELEAVQTRWREAIESTLSEAQDRAAGGLNEHARGLMTQLQDEMARHATAARESAASTVTEAEQRIAALRDTLQEQTQWLESALARAGDTSQRLEQHSAQLENAQQQALTGFQAQLENALSSRREEMQRRSEAIFEEINARIRTTFEEASRQAVAQFDRQVAEMVLPHVSRAEEAVHRLAGGRSLLDAALTLQQDRIRNSADEAFAESLARFRENLGSVEQILQESSQAITGRSLAELEGKAGDLKHQMVEELLKSAEWYEKKAQTQIQNLTERTIEHAGNELRERAGDISSVFASELDHASRSFVGHAQTQMEEVVRDAFERARALFAEAADTTAAACTDEGQRTGRQ